MRPGSATWMSSSLPDSQSPSRIESRGARERSAVSADSSAQATDDQITMEIGRRFDYRSASTQLVSARSNGIGHLRHRHTSAWPVVSCCNLPLRWHVVKKPPRLLTRFWIRLADHISLDTAGVYAWGFTKTAKSISEIPLVATRQTGSHSYRRPPEALIESVASEDGQAILARNVVGDGQLARENSRGEIDVESVIIAPVRDHEGRLRGMMHLTTAVGEPPLGGDELEFVVAACEILAESLWNLSDRRRLVPIASSHSVASP